jgi:hypothetical protein
MDEYSPPSNNLAFHRATAVFAFFLPFRAQHKILKSLLVLGTSPHASTAVREHYREL